MSGTQPQRVRGPAGPRKREPSRSPLGDQVADALLAQIVGGEFQPGEPLPPEPVLAQQQDVSRLTLREAIGILRQKGIVEVRRGRGTYVRERGEWSPLDPHVLGAYAQDSAGQLASMGRLLEARRVVEVGVAGLAAGRRRRGDLTLMADALTRMQHAGQDVDEFVAADLDFHDALMGAAGNPVLGAMFAPLRELLQAHRRASSSLQRDRAQAVRLHGDILAAVTDKDQKRARAAMAEHLRLTELGVRRAHRRRERTSQTDGGIE